MSRPKARDFRTLSPEELVEKKRSLEKEDFELRQKKVSGQLDKPHQFKLVHRQIAQINTVLREKLHVER